MENFFIEDEFFSGIEDYLSWAELDEESVPLLPDDWEQKVDESNLEKIFEADSDIIECVYDFLIDNNEERFGSEPNERIDKEIKDAIRVSIDLEKLNSLLPELYYPNGKTAKLTKKDLLQYI